MGDVEPGKFFAIFFLQRKMQQREDVPEGFPRLEGFALLNMAAVY